MEKERDKERAEVRLAANRCPFCREHCADEAGTVACRGCLARHHAACWDEHGRCGACGSERRYEEGGGSAAPRLTRERAETLLEGAGHPRGEVEAFLASLSSATTNTSSTQVTVQAPKGSLLTALGKVLAVLFSGVGALLIFLLLGSKIWYREGAFGRGPPTAEAIMFGIGMTLLVMGFVSVRLLRAPRS